jgi:AAA domain
MNNTRHTASGADLAFLHAPQVAELRALSGSLVSEKAQLYGERRHREMLFFLHALSLTPGGLKVLARRMLADFPENIGTATMREVGMKPGTVYCGDEYGDRERIEGEMAVEGNDAAAMAREGGTRGKDGSVEFFRARCAWLIAHKLPLFLGALCCDPRTDLEQLERDGDHPAAGYLVNLWPMLSHYKAEAELLPAGSVLTSIGGQVNAALDHALATRRMVIVEGHAGSGKTHAAEQWAARNAGRARFVSLSGITQRTSFFQKLAAVVGLSVEGRKAAWCQAWIEDFFAKTKLMLVIDEAHYLWPQTRRCEGAPELVNWINTALVNQGVPVALICTDQFIRLKRNVEKQSGWTSEQLAHRVKRYTKLPERPTEDDLRAVAAFQLAMQWSAEAGVWQPGDAEAPARSVDLVVAYALLSGLPMATVRDVTDEARALAREAGRTRLIFGDVKRALIDFQIPSDEAMRAAFPPAARVEPKGRTKARVAGPSAELAGAQESDTPADDFGPAVRRETRPLLLPIPSRGTAPAGIGV